MLYLIPFLVLAKTWLVFDDNAMFCLLCKEAEAVDTTVSHKKSLISGNCQFKLDSIKMHKESHNHKSAKAIVAEKNRPCVTPVVKFFLTHSVNGRWGLLGHDKF